MQLVMSLNNVNLTTITSVMPGHEKGLSAGLKINIEDTVIDVEGDRSRGNSRGRRQPPVEKKAQTQTTSPLRRSQASLFDPKDVVKGPHRAHGDTGPMIKTTARKVAKEPEATRKQYTSAAYISSEPDDVESDDSPEASVHSVKALSHTSGCTGFDI